MNGTLLVDGDKLRLHFNKHGSAPYVWNVSTPDGQEISIKGFRAFVPFETVYAPKATPDDEDGKPSAWLAPVQISRQYNVILHDGWATIQYVNTGGL